MKRQAMLVLSFICQGLCLASEASDDLRATLNNAALPFDARFKAAQELAAQHRGDPQAMEALCRAIKLKSPYLPQTGSGQAVSTAAMFPIVSLVQEMGEPAFPSLMDAYANEPDARTRSIIGLPLSILIEKNPPLRGKFIKRLMQEIDTHKKDRLRQFAVDILQVEDAQIKAASPHPLSGQQESPFSPEQKPEQKMSQPSELTASNIGTLTTSTPQPAPANRTDSLLLGAGIGLIVTIGLLWALLRKNEK